MINVIEGDSTTFSTLVYGAPSMHTVEYLGRQYEQLSPDLVNSSPTLQRAKELYEQFNGSEAIAKARALLNSISNIVDPNYIGKLSTIEQFQTASNLMQKYVMANPVIRRLYQKDRCNGYVETYYDPEPHAIGEDHYHYRRVMDGVVQYTDDEDTAFKVSLYLDPIVDDDRPLLIEEQLDLLDTWDILENLINQNKQDPTDPFGSLL